MTPTGSLSAAELLALTFFGIRFFLPLSTRLVAFFLLALFTRFLALFTPPRHVRPKLSRGIVTAPPGVSRPSDYGLRRDGIGVPRFIL
jgi:hypothetical protein